MGLSTMAGMMSSLRAIFTPSATACSDPPGPTRFGPSRICMRATIFRSATTAIIGVSSRNAKIARDLAMISHRGSWPNRASESGP